MDRSELLGLGLSGPELEVEERQHLKERTAETALRDRTEHKQKLWLIRYEARKERWNIRLDVLDVILNVVNSRSAKMFFGNLVIVSLTLVSVCFIARAALQYEFDPTAADLYYIEQNLISNNSSELFGSVYEDTKGLDNAVSSPMSLDEAVRLKDEMASAYAEKRGSSYYLTKFYVVETTKVPCWEVKERQFGIDQAVSECYKNFEAAKSVRRDLENSRE